MSVVHENYSVSQENLSFDDKGLVLPFGLKSWRHQHIVQPHKSGALIIDKVFIDEENNFRKYFISTSYFQSGKIPYLLGEEYGDQQKRPLLVYIGGSFSKLFSNITKNFHKRFIRLGYRVISFENFICDCSISRSPQFPFFDLKTQGMAYYDAIRKVHAELLAQGKSRRLSKNLKFVRKKDRIKSPTHLFGREQLREAIIHAVVIEDKKK